MTSRRTALLIACAVLLAGCAVGRPSGFVGRSNSFCSDALTTIGALVKPTTTKAQLQYATDRYTAMDKTISELTDSTLPAGSVGSELRTKWLRPARASLTAGRSALETLRRDLSSHSSSTAAFARTQQIGVEGVDTDLLAAQHLTTCARLFTPTT